MQEEPKDEGRAPSALDALRGRPALVVASTGGHLEQAVRWSDKLQLAPESTFVTFDNEQSRSLLAGRRHHFVTYVAPRDMLGILKALPPVLRALNHGRFDAILTTGAGLALSSYVPALMHRVPVMYIESVSRFVAPSLTGNALSVLPGARTFTQHAAYQGRRWRLVESLLTDYEPVPPTPPVPPRSFFITLGTIRPFRFDALISSVLGSLDPDDHVVWQLGATDRRDLPGTSFEAVTMAEFDEYATAADVVVSHAGVGTILRLLDLGVSPIVVPRLQRRGEHVDDHQLQVATRLAQLRLITTVDAERLSTEVLHGARPRIVSSTAGRLR